MGAQVVLAEAEAEAEVQGLQVQEGPVVAQALTTTRFAVQAIPEGRVSLAVSMRNMVAGVRASSTAKEGMAASVT